MSANARRDYAASNASYVEALTRPPTTALTTSQPDLSPDDIEWVAREPVSLPKGCTTIIMIPEGEIEWFASSVGRLR